MDSEHLLVAVVEQTVRLFHGQRQVLHAASAAQNSAGSKSQNVMLMSCTAREAKLIIRPPHRRRFLSVFFDCVAICVRLRFSTLFVLLLLLPQLFCRILYDGLEVLAIVSEQLTRRHWASTRSASSTSPSMPPSSTSSSRPP
eukprot:GHVS01033324.1.p1 GENE.GHVS01033324.1~~GHVS01033324.1.p1  ORF type:complete len:142 (+),score=14.21 GHVS01033324.1:326-751(+)